MARALRAQRRWRRNGVAQFEEGDGREGFDIGLTELLKHFVAFVEYKVFYVGRVQEFIASECVEPSGGGDDDVGASRLVLKDLSVLGDWGAAVEDGGADVGHVF